MASAIPRLIEFGQSPWYDNLTRALATGGLQTLIDTHGIRGVTSNPTIFEKAMAGGDDYDEQLREVTRAGASTDDAYWDLVTTDIEHAADVLRPVYDRLEAADGYVSVEVSPDLAHDTAATTQQAKELWERLARPNVMIKIPGTAEGLPAIVDTLAAGINVNVTLIFSLERYQEVIGAFLSGLERRAAAGGDLPRSCFGGVVLREPRRHRDRPAAARGSPAAGPGRRRQRQARVSDVPEGAVGRPVGEARSARARASSARCGRRHRPRTRRTPPRSTSTSWSAADTVNTLAQASVDVLAKGDDNLRADSICEDVEGARKVDRRSRRRGRRLRRRDRHARARGRRVVREVVPRRARDPREEGFGVQVGEINVAATTARR